MKALFAAVLSATVLLVLSTFAAAQDEPAATIPAATATSTPATSPADAEVKAAKTRMEIIEKISPSLVRVEYTLQYDKGRTPFEELVLEERPLERAGFLLSPTRVICDDVTAHPRYIKSIRVRFGDQVVTAKPIAWAKDCRATLLELAEPLKTAKPLAFDANLAGPYYTVTYGKADQEWATTVETMAPSTTATDTQRKFINMPVRVVITDKSGRPVAVSFKDEGPLDGSWKGSPLDWGWWSAEQMEQMTKKVQATADQSLLRATITFRSARKDARTPQENPGPGEINNLAVLIAPQTVLVMMYSDPKYTARIERIMIHPNDGSEAVPATFAHSMTDYGCLIATLEKPLAAKAAAPLELTCDDALAYRHKLLLTAEVLIQGETRTAFYGHSRIDSYVASWRQQIFPKISTETYDYFFFNTDGKLVIMPMYRRNKVSLQGKQRIDHPLDTPVCYVKEAIDKLPASADKHNVPLTEEQENRLAWLGVELQPLDRELARLKNVAHLTRDGASGAMVSFVYDDSPAAKQGVKAGDILLRLHVADQPKPIEVIGDPARFRGPFPWSNYDELPESSYDRIPTPWNPAESLCNRVLTDLGFGKEFQAEFVRDGNTFQRPFVVAESPMHYNSAATYKAPGMGLSVRDLTFEVRRYFQKKSDAPGVIVAIVTPGGKAAVAGLKPYEIITQVNEVPVKDVKHFEQLIKDQGELRFLVSRMTQGRTVKLKASATSEPAPKATKTDDSE